MGKGSKGEQYCVIGLGRFGSSLAKELMQLGYEVLGIDRSEELVDDMSAVLTHTLCADATDEDALRAIGIRNFDCCIVAIGGDIQSSIMAAILVKDSGVGKVVVKAVSELHGRVLDKLGVDRVIYPERDMGIRVAHQLVSPNLLDYIELSSEYAVAELAVPGCLNGKALSEIDTRQRYGCSIVAINKPKGIIIAPQADSVLEEKDVMVVIGTNEGIEQFENAVSRG
ncbi:MULTISPECIES: TrkA family potassium uptake protein [unclassified Paenibacillus]|uniref:potassium channel family protein n=1 Tax=unclassified Paenibacillus TaxID=185978 RepID=UPI000955D21C|nr:MULTISPECIES: TrkA family potassium uptake protein [unclassified Paenibacillus]ASS66649.1 TrkA family potassium uptake protein [Paenibacillus sp. RUD330]SIP99763.1 trk system potassium uptake protein TrkA [Paenibacillus sp. RU4X]SIQ18898.1 trk system potassium uptake protein TrkA [Paenibacillus sp. RU4T]